MEFFGVILCILIAALLSIPLGNYIKSVMNGKKVFLSKYLIFFERKIYNILGVENEKQMNFKEYSFSVLSLSFLGFLVSFFLFMFQGVLFLNPQKVESMPWDLAFSAALSFVTNTGFQSYSENSNLSYFSHVIGVTTQNFISPSVGLSVFFAFIRGFSGKKEGKLGNFWVDMTRSILYIFIPLSFVLSVLLISQGTIQNFSSYCQVNLLETISKNGATDITKQIILQGPVASTVAIKQLGNSAGGFFYSNGAHPFENPTLVSNIFEMISILVIPMSLLVSFGELIKDKKYTISMFLVAICMLITSVFAISFFELNDGLEFTKNAENSSLIFGNMEGKESRIGIIYSSAWTASTALVSSGLSNSSIGSYTPFSGVLTILQMILGGIVFGGIGSGIYRIIAFSMIVIFIISVFAKKSPEYLGKKIEDFEIKMSIIICFIPYFLTLIGSAVACTLPEAVNNTTNIGPHGFSEVFYNFLSLSLNNGSTFSGFRVNSAVFNVLTGLIMLVSRFIPIVSVLALADSFSNKEEIVLVNTKISNIFCIFSFVVFVGLITFLPALLLGPIVEYFKVIY